MSETPILQTTSKNVYDGLMKMFDHHRYVCLNTYVFNGYESDFLSVTVDKNQFIYEVEVKVSVSDFKKDFVSKAWKHEMMQNSGVSTLVMKNYGEYPDWMDKDLNGKTLHGLQKGTCCPLKYVNPSEGLPNKFFFATPKGLLTKDMIPPYAGLIEFELKHGDYVESKVVKQAPFLHKKKLFEKIKNTLLDKLWWEAYNSRTYLKKEGNWKKMYDTTKSNLDKVYYERLDLMNQIDILSKAMEEKGMNAKEIWQNHLDENQRKLDEIKSMRKGTCTNHE